MTSLLVLLVGLLLAVLAFELSDEARLRAIRAHWPALTDTRVRHVLRVLFYLGLGFTVAQQYLGSQETSERVEGAIRDVRLAVHVVVSADWAAGQPSALSVRGGGGTVATLVDPSDPTAKPIVFSGVFVEFKPAPDGKHAEYTVVGRVERGGWPLGATEEDLLGYSRLSVRAPAHRKGLARDGVVKAEAVAARVRVNDADRPQHDAKPGQAVRLPEEEAAAPAWFAFDLALFEPAP